LFGWVTVLGIRRAVLKVMKNEGPCEKVTQEDVLEALRFMKNGNAVGPSGVTIDLLKVCGIESTKRLVNVANDVPQGNSMLKAGEEAT